MTSALRTAVLRLQPIPEVENVANALRDMGYTVVSAEAEQVPSTYTTLTDEDQIKKMGLLLETLEDNDDVQNVWHNWDMPDED